MSENSLCVAQDGVTLKKITAMYPSQICIETFIGNNVVSNYAIYYNVTI